MHKITQSILRDFASTYEYESSSNGEQLEHLINYLVSLDEYGSLNDPTKLWTGEQEVGIDGAFVIVNDELVHDDDEVDDLVSQRGSRKIDAHFVFVQTKSSSSFDVSDINDLGAAVLDFFQDMELNQGEMLRSLYDAKERIYENSSLFDPDVPRLTLYYATTGNWKNDRNLRAAISAQETKLKALDLFRDVLFVTLGSKEIRDRWYASQRTDEATFKFEKRVTMPSVDGVNQAFLGFVPASEVLNVIQTDQDVREHLFLDNMRDYQEGSKVNLEIEKTLQSDARSEFVFLNNGITIVARSAQTSGDNITIRDFQIVNGCQTTHVMYDEQDNIDETVYVPLKVVVTDDTGITNRIIRATNYSNPFDESQLWSTATFHKDLETYFDGGRAGPVRLFYERRKGQFRHGSAVKSRTVTPKDVLKATASIFFERPQDATKYASVLYPMVGKRMFRDGDNLYCYYFAALLDTSVNDVMRHFTEHRDVRPCKYHIMTAFKILYESDTTDLRTRSAESNLSDAMKMLSERENAELALRPIISETREYFGGRDVDSYKALSKMTTYKDHITDWARQRRS